MYLLKQLELRRRELGMSHATLARRSRVSLPTVNRIMSGRHNKAAFSHIVAIAHALGVELVVQERESSEEFRNQQALSKAKRLINLVQGSSALEGQAVDQRDLDSMVDRTADKLLHSKRILWAE